MTPFLSVCILTYNRMELLRETLDSILPQVTDLPDVEVVVSDNASTDDTGQMVRGYCERHPRLRYTCNPTNVRFDGNVVACIEKAAGEYTAFFSDDDVAPPGYVAGLLKDLTEFRPIAAYTNHTPFFDHKPANLGAPTQPVLKRLFTNPTEFYLYCGLGFISSLILKTSEARKHISKVVPGRETAQVDIAFRVVLASAGPFLFDGTLTVLARHVENSVVDDPLTNGAINSTKVQLDLLAEGLLTERDVDWYNRKIIRIILPRLIVNNRIKARNIVSASEMRKLYGRDPLFYIYAYPLLLIPAPLLRRIGLPLRALMRMRRRSQLKRGKVPAPRHLAPP